MRREVFARRPIPSRKCVPVRPVGEPARHPMGRREGLTGGGDGLQLRNQSEPGGVDVRLRKVRLSIDRAWRMASMAKALARTFVAACAR
jgi:hypothetical protein